MNAVYSVPGTFAVTYEGDPDEGRIVRMTFTPLASDAGWVGPPAEYEYTEGDSWDDKNDAEELDIVSADGPFWKAVQAALLTTYAAVDINADGARPRTVVPIEWTE